MTAANVALVAFAQFAAVAIVLLVRRNKATALALCCSAAVFAVAIGGVSLMSATRPNTTAPVVQASMVATTRPQHLCHEAKLDMSPHQIEQLFGKPDEVRPDEETRGPGATVWIYRQSRCAVHLFDDKVEFVE